MNTEPCTLKLSLSHSPISTGIHLLRRAVSPVSRVVGDDSSISALLLTLAAPAAPRRCRLAAKERRPLPLACSLLRNIAQPRRGTPQSPAAQAVVSRVVACVLECRHEPPTTTQGSRAVVVCHLAAGRNKCGEIRTSRKKKKDSGTLH